MVRSAMRASSEDAQRCRAPHHEGLRPHPSPGCHAPPPGLAFGEPDDRLRRGIQYAAAYRLNLRRLWNTGSSAGACHRAAIRPTRWRTTTRRDRLKIESEARYGASKILRRRPEQASGSQRRSGTHSPRERFCEKVPPPKSYREITRIGSRRSPGDAPFPKDILFLEELDND